MRRVAALALLFIGIGSASSLAAKQGNARPSVVAPPVAMRDSMCDPQNPDVSNWEVESTSVIIFRHPPGYAKPVIDPRLLNEVLQYQGTVYASHLLLVGWGKALDSLDYGLGRSRRLSACVAIIGGRPAIVATYAAGAAPGTIVAGSYQGTETNVGVSPPAQVVGGGSPGAIAANPPDQRVTGGSQGTTNSSNLRTGTIPSLLVVQWNEFQGLPAVYLAIWRQDRTTLAQMRQVMWTAQFPGMIPDSSAALKCATPIRPRGELSDYLDTAFVGMLTQSLWAATPHGFTVFELAFDSTGSVSRVEVVAGDLPASTQKSLASIVASNAKPQPPRVARAGIRAEAADSGFKYQLIPVSACPSK